MWYDMLCYMIRNDIWYDIRYDMVWYDTIWYGMVYEMIYDIIRYDIWYDMIYDMRWYMILYHLIWYHMIWYDKIWYHMIWYHMEGWVQNATQMVWHFKIYCTIRHWMVCFNIWLFGIYNDINVEDAAQWDHWVVRLLTCLQRTTPEKTRHERVTKIKLNATDYLVWKVTVVHLVSIVFPFPRPSSSLLFTNPTNDCSPFDYGGKKRQLVSNQSCIRVLLWQKCWMV